MSANPLRTRAAAIRLVALDVDGVLTDGLLAFDRQGDAGKQFSVRDGFGLALLRDAGLDLAIITGRHSGAVAARAAELRINHVLSGVADKAAGLHELADRTGIALTSIAYLGDDWPDLPALRLAGLAAAPADAEPDVKACCHWIASRSGGRGAVREFAEWLLAQRGQRDALLQRYLSGTSHAVG